MYKKQLLAQKVLCMVALILCAAVFLYSLGIMTDLYDLIRGKNNIGVEADPYYTTVAGSWVYYEMQPFNRSFTAYSIGMLLLAVFLFITNTHSRRKYYFGNYLATGLFTVAGAAFTVWCHQNIEFYKAEFLKMDFAALKAVADKMKGYYTESTALFDLHYFIFGAFVIILIALIVNVIVKVRLMKAEDRLIAEGKEAAHV